MTRSAREPVFYSQHDEAQKLQLVTGFFAPPLTQIKLWRAVIEKARTQTSFAWGFCFLRGPYWIRTSDFYHVEVAL